MIQLTSQEAIEFYEGSSWRNWTAAEIAEFQLKQERLCVSLEAYENALEETLDRNVKTHELALNREGLKDELSGGNAPTDEEHGLMLAAYNVTPLKL